LTKAGIFYQQQFDKHKYTTHKYRGFTSLMLLHKLLGREYKLHGMENIG
jgi:hypothetical protein